jgi:hypothetical protein
MGYRDDVRELNSRKSPTVRKILFREDSSDDRDVLEEGVACVGVMEVEVIATELVMAILR